MFEFVISNLGIFMVMIDVGPLRHFQSWETHGDDRCGNCFPLMLLPSVDDLDCQNKLQMMCELPFACLSVVCSWGGSDVSALTETFTISATQSEDFSYVAGQSYKYESV